MKIYRHIYDKSTNEDGSDKPNEFLGDFEIEDEGELNDYSFDVIGIKDNQKYRIIGQEISYLMDRYNAGTKVFVELIN